MIKPLAERCDGLRWRRGLVDAAAWLGGQVVEIDALNVFPVPDGDTGTNMALTIQAAVRAAEPSEPSVAAVARAAAEGALLGARGNSGVILSQFLRGIARALERHADLGGSDLARALALASATADKAVLRPVEGTMLTVGRDAAQAAVGAAEAGAGLIAVLEAAVEAARLSVARTPSLLPVLRQAGVVDAGGQGLLCLLEGLLRSLRGEAGLPRAAGATGPAQAAEVAAGVYGYCTEFLLRGDSLDLEAIRERIVDLGDSALVVGEANLVRVHVHTFRPGLVLEYAGGLGTLHQIKIDNMQDQHEHVLSGRERSAGPAWTPPAAAEPAPAAPLAALVAVAAGPGFTEIFRSLGVSVVVPGGQTMNPSTEELLRAVEQTPAARVLLLPNNGNVVLAAKQVGLLTDKQVEVIPTQDMAQGVAAAMAFQPDADLTANARAMERACRGVRTAEVTCAVRAARIDGLEIRPGETLGLVGGRLAAAGPDPAAVVAAVLVALEAERAELLALYYGADVAAEEAEALAAQVRARYRGQQVELHSGGQPLYHYLISAE